MRYFLPGCVLIAMAISAGGQTSDKVELKDIKLDQLTKAIEAHKGKLVVVDVWSTTCLPCMREFPHLVEMHKKHAKDGVVCISVSLDDKESADTALKFLKKQNATFANYRFDGKTEDELHNAWIFSAIPVVRVYDRAGKLTKHFTNADPDKQFTHKDVAKLVESMLKK